MSTCNTPTTDRTLFHRILFFVAAAFSPVVLKVQLRDLQGVQIFSPAYLAIHVDPLGVPEDWFENHCIRQSPALTPHTRTLMENVKQWLVTGLFACHSSGIFLSK